MDAFRYRGNRDLRDGLRYRETPFRLLCAQGAHRIDDLVPTIIGDGDGEGHSFVGCGRFRATAMRLVERRAGGPGGPTGQAFTHAIAGAACAAAGGFSPLTRMPLEREPQALDT